MMTEHESVDRYKHGTLRYIIYAGAPTYRADQRLALQKLGPVMVQYFGLGEVTGNITVLPPCDHSPDDAAMPRLGSCGYARTRMEVSIQYAEGNPMPDGPAGGVCGCGAARVGGVLNNPQATLQPNRHRRRKS